MVSKRRSQQNQELVQQQSRAVDEHGFDTAQEEEENIAGGSQMSRQRSVVSAPAGNRRMPPPPPPPRTNVPSTVNFVGAGGNGSGGGGSNSSVSSSSASSSKSVIPVIPSYHNLGARGSKDSTPSKLMAMQPDPIAQAKYAKKFTRAVPLVAEELDEIEVIVPKSARGKVGSKEYVMNQKLATDSIEHKFGVPSHLVTGHIEEGDQTRQMYIQQQYVDTLSKIESVKQRIVEYDMIDIARTPVGIRDPGASSIIDMFMLEDVNILDGWNTIEWKTACTYQWAINTHMEDVDQLSSKWLKMLLSESCTTEMREIIMLEYDNLDSCFRGGITFAWILCIKLFGLNRDTTAALINFLKLFRDKGLRRYQGENVAVARKEQLAVCSRLREAKELPQETPLDLLTGLTLCSVDKFKSLFEYKLQQSKVESLEGRKHLSQAEIFSEVKVLLTHAAQYYDSLNVSNIWNQTKTPRVNVFGKPNDATESTCWNCGRKGHGVDKCTAPRNDQKIAENRRKWMEARKGGKGGTGGENYEREKWGPPKSGESSVRYFEGVHFTYCGRKHNGVCCGWNTTHSSKYHAKWVSQGSSFDLASECPTHELVQRSRPSTTIKGSSSPSRAGSTTAHPTANFALPESVRNAISQLNDSVRTPNEQLLMEGVMRSLNLN